MRLLKQWPHMQLASICTKIGSGSTPRGGDGVYVDAGTAIIRSQNIYNGKFSVGGLAHLTEKHAEQLNGVTVESRDVLLNITGDSVARCCSVPEWVLPARVNQHVAIVRPDSSQLLPEFLCYYFVSPLMQKYLLSRAGSGGTRNALTKGMIESLEVPCPDLATQQRVVNLLRNYDDLIENNRRRIQLLEQAARLLYKEWFVHLRFPGHEHVKIKDGVPEGWEKKLLGDIISTNPDSYQARELPDEINYIDISSVAQGHIISKTPLSSTEAPGRARRKAKNGDVIWSNVRPNLRAYALILDPEENDVFSTGFTVLSPEGVPFTYLYLTVTTDEFVSHLVNHATGVSYPAVRPDDFERAAVLVPPKQILEVFQEKTEPSFRLKSVLEKEIKALTKARDLLLPRLMNGEVVA